ncbi:hypothetical protein [Legionella spiritensis]|uniref:Putative Cytochrome c, class I n=1 Tax=Legionella spiritensis TaxID=452 RepID=A0A0W0Z4N5_LEGSP|nr:hypothetical protein [Legionella spiritensis]KTD64112.1 putative Cytochrome c, class I precursor [Legionella spiritensis]SNV37888.1 putative Cytochrome c, class I precursor [Legionella spiritensis]
MTRLLLVIVVLMMNTIAVQAENIGKITYKEACSRCHAPQLAMALKAPAAFDKKAWNIRFKEAAVESDNNPEQFKTPMDYFLYNVKIGKGLMHHKGLCKESGLPDKYCTDEALTQAILYMSKNDHET